MAISNILGNTQGNILGNIIIIRWATLTEPDIHSVKFKLRI